MSGVSYQFMSHVPLSGARIYLEELPEFSAISDANGAFVIEGIPHGAWITPYVELENHRTGGHYPFRNWCKWCIMGRGLGPQHRAASGH